MLTLLLRRLPEYTRISFFASALLLTACSSLNTSPPQTNVDWSEHQSAVQQFQQWTLQGRLNIRTENESSTISINWKQDTDSFLINLSGTLGLGAIQIEGNDQTVRIEKAGEAPVFANSLEEISSTQLGYELPASQLYYWIRGISAPGASNIQLNDNQRLDELLQDGWQIKYDRYQEQANGLVLPERIKVDQPPYRLTFIISHW